MQGAPIGVGPAHEDADLLTVFAVPGDPSGGAARA